MNAATSSLNSFDQELAQYIDHTLLKPEATQSQIDALCHEAASYQFASVCIHPCYVAKAVENLKNSDIPICTVIGFPLGATTTDVKIFEAQKAFEAGATEFDMVINIGAAKSGDFDLIENEIRAVVQTVQGSTVTVILETALLTETEIQKICERAKIAGAHYVKTSTGFSSRGASLKDIEIMRAAVGPDMGVKASGGIKDRKTAKRMIAAGANRIGTSSGIAIVSELEREEN
ncbi:MAG: deoxyribose-phosphate aldolase [Verrucomicrobia bacterium]|nr:deoxyribose-phosphate aldolase [Verrucomicrobiota bacterium]MDE3047269.1 deoxyribose-phosphate aldolase [Verrucomicrobiota bacterium]